jgi:L-xylulose reductase
MTSQNGRRILVTGAGGAIGGAIVRKLASQGAQVVAADMSVEMLRTIVEETDAQPLAFDLTSEDSIRDALGDLDVYGAVNCAGWGGVLEPPQAVSADMFDRGMAINARGALLVIKYTAQSMIRGGKGGSIVNISSQAALVALVGHVSYAASKAALDSITRCSAQELGKYGIRVNSVAPTVVLSPMTRGYWDRPEIEGPFLAAMPLGRWATEDEIAAPIVFLLSDEAAMITGVCLPIDGGYTSQ